MNRKSEVDNLGKAWVTSDGPRLSCRDPRTNLDDPVSDREA